MKEKPADQRAADSLAHSAPADAGPVTTKNADQAAANDDDSETSSIAAAISAVGVATLMTIYSTMRLHKGSRQSHLGNQSGLRRLRLGRRLLG